MISDLTYDFNGEKIRGKLYLPENRKNNSIVILSHGLSLDYSIMLPYAQKLYDKGIASYAYDFRGGGYDCHSDGRISDMTIHTEMEDLNFIIDSVMNEEFVDEDKVFLAGHSQGGLVTALLAPKRNDISAIFLFAPAFEIPDDMKEKDNPRPMNVLNVMPEYMGEKYIDDAISIDVFNIIGDFTGQVNIFHGLEDKRVPVDYIVRADKVYENSTVYLYEDGEHRFSDEIKDDVVSIICDKIDEMLL